MAVPAGRRGGTRGSTISPVVRLQLQAPGGYQQGGKYKADSCQRSLHVHPQKWLHCRTGAQRQAAVCGAHWKRGASAGRGTRTSMAMLRSLPLPLPLAGAGVAGAAEVGTGARVCSEKSFARYLPS